VKGGDILANQWLYDGVRDLLSRVGGAAIDTVGSTTFGPAWPLIKPIVEPIKKLFGPSPSDQAMAAFLVKWDEEEERKRDRQALVRLVVDGQQDAALPSTIRLAKTLAATETEERTRRDLLRAQGRIIILAGRAIRAILNGEQTAPGRARRDLSVLGFSQHLIELVIFNIVEGRNSLDADLVNVPLQDVRTAVACQLHPLLRMLFELALGAGTADEDLFIAAAAEVADRLHLGELTKHAFTSFRARVSASEADLLARLNDFCDAIVEFA
jgi:hypothetical protein